jgi:hypothetical protein
MLDVLAKEDPPGIWLFGTVRIMGDYCGEEGNKKW